MRTRTKTPKKDVALFELLRTSFAEEEIHNVLLGALLSLDEAGLFENKAFKEAVTIADEVIQGVLHSKDHKEWDPKSTCQTQGEA